MHHNLKPGSYERPGADAYGLDVNGDYKIIRSMRRRPIFNRILRQLSIVTDDDLLAIETDSVHVTCIGLKNG